MYVELVRVPGVLVPGTEGIGPRAGGGPGRCAEIAKVANPNDRILKTTLMCHMSVLPLSWLCWY